MKKREYTYEDKLNYIADLYCPARAVHDETGLSWELTLAQAAHETGWGEKTLPGTFNAFNIKADPAWKGEKKNFYVWESKNGKSEWVHADFRVYPDYLASVRDRTSFLTKNPRYADKGLFKPGTLGNYLKEAEALHAASFATDPDYVAKLKKLFEGPTMKRAIARAQQRGCGPLLPVVEVVILDGAKVPIANARVRVTVGGKQAEVASSADGHLNIRTAPSAGDLKMHVFDENKQQWIVLEPVEAPSAAKGKTVTLIAPTFTARTNTRVHEKTAPPNPPAATKPPATSKPPAANTPPAANKAPAAGKPDSAQASAGKFREHKVAKGESLWIISEKYSVRYQAIAEANGIRSPYVIRRDQVLRIPPSDAAPKPKAPASAPKTAPATKDQGNSGGMTLADLAKHIAGGATAMHTVYFRNEKENPQTDLMHSSRAPWMVPAQAEFEKGVKRRTGAGKHDPRILEYFTATPGLNKKAAAVDETPYCSAFVNWCLAKAGFKGTGNALAASFAKWGRPTKGNAPALGAVALIKYDDGSHHVTFVAGVSKNGESVATLGGNQGNAHEVSHSRCEESLIIAYRYPADYPDYDDDYILHDVKSDHAPMTASSTH